MHCNVSFGWGCRDICRPLKQFTTKPLGPGERWYCIVVFNFESEDSEEQPVSNYLVLQATVSYCVVPLYDQLCSFAVTVPCQPVD